jgi:hypothetical protein
MCLVDSFGLALNPFEVVGFSDGAGTLSSGDCYCQGFLEFGPHLRGLFLRRFILSVGSIPDGECLFQGASEGMTGRPFLQKPTDTLDTHFYFLFPSN